MKKLPVYWIWFAQLKGISPWVKRQLLEEFRDPEELYRAEEKALPAEVAAALQDKDLNPAMEIYRQCNLKNIGLLPYRDAAYPERLRNIEDPPLLLYFKGKLPDWQKQPAIGIVGTRKASPYGLHTTRQLAAQIAVCGGLVVSGAATGIDRAAMEAALDVKKATVAILASGVDVVYPASSRELYSRTEVCGCLLSEYPPGTRPYPGNFLYRNRIISGLSDGVLVVEAPAKSGALNTAQHAFSQGRDLFAVPGNLGVDTCMGSNALLQEGAYAALSGWDVMKHYENLYPGSVENRSVPLLKSLTASIPKVAEISPIPEKRTDRTEKPAKISIDNLEKSTYSVINKPEVTLNEQEQLVFNLIGDDPQLPDGILDAASLPSGTVQSILTRLAIKGFINYLPDGRLRRK